MLYQVIFCRRKKLVLKRETSLLHTSLFIYLFMYLDAEKAQETHLQQWNKLAAKDISKSLLLTVTELPAPSAYFVRALVALIHWPELWFIIASLSLGGFYHQVPLQHGIDGPRALSHCWQHKSLVWIPHLGDLVSVFNASVHDVFAWILSSFSDEVRSLKSEKWKTGIETTKTGY